MEACGLVDMVGRRDLVNTGGSLWFTRYGKEKRPFNHRWKLVVSVVRYGKEKRPCKHRWKLVVV